MQNRDLSQVFLINEDYLKRISKLVGTNKKVYERGGGTGNLSKHLIGNELSIVEIDTRYNKYLIEYGEVINTNCLKLKISSEVIVGCIPYHITNEILYHSLINYDYKVIYYLVQEEVADRLVSNKGKNYGALSVFSQLFNQVKKEFRISRYNFQPVPKVDSALISITLVTNLSKEEKNKYLNSLKYIFKNRRKKLKSYLKDYGNYGESRADSLTIENYKDLFKLNY